MPTTFGVAVVGVESTVPSTLIRWPPVEKTWFMSSDSELPELNNPASRAAGGSEEALRELVVMVTPRMESFLRRKGLAWHDVEDVAQSDWIRICSRLVEYDSRRPYRDAQYELEWRVKPEQVQSARAVEHWSAGLGRSRRWINRVSLDVLDRQPHTSSFSSMLGRSSRPIRVRVRGIKVRTLWSWSLPLPRRHQSLTQRDSRAAVAPAGCSRGLRSKLPVCCLTMDLPIEYIHPKLTSLPMPPQLAFAVRWFIAPGPGRLR